MNINIVCVGNLKEKYWRDGVDEYSKRLSRFCKLEIREIKESRLPDKASRADEEKVIEAEGREIIKAIKKGSYIITLEIKGKELSSEAFAEKLQELPLEGVSDISFVIGGSLGLSPEVSKLADYKLSFSKMTYPHQMMRVILLEQIYRGFKINSGEKYHK
ncbi:MAG: 23S rRNA (pseudouridine(1915)-N(3))-methyltransferase RlmH [Clostridia bacterium]|nr:23S rRNA (pseudouridine(1915)-N(3))-methyltransferase RlmH [Clostridia bacterium]